MDIAFTSHPIHVSAVRPAYTRQYFNVIEGRFLYATGHVDYVPGTDTRPAHFSGSAETPDNAKIAVNRETRESVLKEVIDWITPAR